MTMSATALTNTAGEGDLLARGEKVKCLSPHFFSIFHATNTWWQA